MFAGTCASDADTRVPPCYGRLMATKKTVSSKTATKKRASAKTPKRPAVTAAAKAKRGGGARRKPAAVARAPAVEEFKAAEPVVAEVVEAEPVVPAAEPEVVEETWPELGFAARVPPPLPERPRPLHRRAIFFDVENTSRSSDVLRMLEQLAIDRIGTDTELIASGNWRVIGGETGRLLARSGAHLVHSAPTVGVRDWSDLRIAVSAGMWLASAHPGDRIDVVSDDKAFDVIGDVAASMGVEFVRHSFRAALRAAAGQKTGERTGERAAAAPRTRRRRGGERPAPAAAPKGAGAASAAPAPRRERPQAAARPAPVKPAPAPAAAPTPGEEVPSTEPVTAPPDELLAIVEGMLSDAPNGIMLDVVAKRLKERGFARPPGSPRLVTRLRGFKELDVSPRGLIRARRGAVAPAEQEQPEAEAAVEESTEPGAVPLNGEAEGAAGSSKRRRRRRGGRSRSNPAAAE